MNIKTCIQSPHLTLAMLTLLAGCGGGGGGGTATPPPTAPQSFAITGQLSGLPDGSSVTLGNGNDTLVVRTNGSFSFPAKLASGSNYNVVVSNASGLACGVKNGSANVGNNDVTDVAIRCLPVLLAGANPTIANITSITSDGSGSAFVLDATRQAIFKVGADGTATLYAGQPGIVGCQDGSGDTASFHFVSSTSSLVADRDGNLLVSDSGSRTIRKITPARVVSTLAGQATCLDATSSTPTQSGKDGAGTQASFINPGKMTLANNGDLLVLDQTNALHNIRRVTATGVVSTLNYQIAPGQNSNINIGDLTALANDDIFFANQDQTVWKLGNGQASRFVGIPLASTSQDGPRQSAGFSAIRALTHDADGNLYVGDAEAIRKIATDGTVSTLAGKSATPGQQNGNGNVARFGQIGSLAIGPNGTLLAGDSLYRDLRSVNLASTVVSTRSTAGLQEYRDGTGSNANFNQINRIAALTDGSVYVVDESLSVIRKITPSGQVSVVPGTTILRLNDVVSDGKGNLYPMEQPNAIVSKIDANGKISEGPRGSGGLGNTRQFAISGAGNIADINVAFKGNITVNSYANNGLIASIDAARIKNITNLPDDPATGFNPQGLVFDSNGNLYFGDAGSLAVYKLATNGTLTLFAGTPGKAGNSDGAPGRATLGFYSATYMTIDNSGNLYLSGQGRIRKISPDGTLSTPNLPWGYQAVGSIAFANSTLFGTVGNGVVQTPLP